MCKVEAVVNFQKIGSGFLLNVCSVLIVALYDLAGNLRQQVACLLDHHSPKGN